MDSSTARIIQLLAEMQDAFDHHKIKIAVNNYFDFVPPFMREDAIEWLTNFSSGPYRDWKNVWKMQSEEMWQRYLLWDDFKDYREVKMLKAASARLKQECKTLPAIFNRRKCIAAINEMNKK